MIWKGRNSGAAPHPGDGGADAPAGGTGSKDENFGAFVLKLALAVLIFRSFIFSPFTIPSESMLPQLMNGDYLVAAKWPYGFTRHSLPFSLPLIPGRILASQPERGDIVIFKHPVDGSDYIKRVVGLPGDTVEVRGGQVVLNGQKLRQERAADAVVKLSDNTICHPAGTPVTDSDGEPACRYMQLRETNLDGRSYDIFDFGQGPADNFAPIIVPEGRVFVMGDNRDNSLDSRFPAAPGAGVGLVPQDLLVGRASRVLWSTDGSAQWLLPWTWFTAARWDRIWKDL